MLRLSGMRALSVGLGVLAVSFLLIPLGLRLWLDARWFAAQDLEPIFALRLRTELALGLGAALGAVLVFGATVQPWYLLWAAIPLASAAAKWVVCSPLRRVRSLPALTARESFVSGESNRSPGP